MDDDLLPEPIIPGRRYAFDFGDGGEQKSGNTATWTGAIGAIMGPNATGLYINHSETILEGWVINGAKIGIHVQNTPLTGDNYVILGIGGNVLTGRGTGVGVGLLIDNSASETDSSNVLVGTGTTISTAMAASARTGGRGVAARGVSVTGPWSAKQVARTSGVPASSP